MNEPSEFEPFKFYKTLVWINSICLCAPPTFISMHSSYSLKYNVIVIPWVVIPWEIIHELYVQAVKHGIKYYLIDFFQLPRTLGFVKCSTP